ncbi:unnamed protein product [Polarella glacialis]|uniref:Uncharacterized protein n=1 Tax=Polarella glacialis TaxID=89957 RepID=A0A813F8R5_POLGL|nr:unnamed protein product [Polarella glacialis]
MKLSFASPALHLSNQRCLTALKQVSERLVGSCRCRQRQKLATKPLSQFKTGCDLDDAALLSSTAAHYAQQARAHVVAVKSSSSKANFRNGDAVVAKTRAKPACWQLFLHHGPSYRVQPVQGVTPDAATVELPMHHLSHCHLAALLQGGGPAGKTASLKAHQATHVPSVRSAHQATQLLSCLLSFHSPVQEGFKLQGRLSRLQVRWVETATLTTTTPSTAGYSLAREGASAWAGQTRSRSILPSLRAANSQCWALRAAPRNEFFCRRCPTFAKSPVRSQILSTQNELLDHTPIVRCQTLCKAGAQDLLKESFGTNDSIAESAVRQSCSKSQAGFCSGHPSQICLSIPMAFSSPNIPVRKHVIMGPRSSTSRTMPHLCDRTCCQQPASALNWSLGTSPGRNYSPACVLVLNRDATCSCISGASLHATCSGPAMLCKHSLLSKVVKVASLLPQASPVTTTTALPAHSSSWMLDCLTFVTHAVAVHVCGSHRKAVKGASFLSVDPLVAACPPKQMSISAPQRLVVQGQVVSRRRSGGISSTSGSCKASWCVPPPPCSPTGLVPLDSKVFVAQSLGKAASTAFQLAREPAFRLAREAPVARRCLRKLPTVPTQGRQPVCISGGRKCSVPAPPTTPPSPWMHSLELILLTPDMHAHDAAMVSSASEACYEVASIADFTLQGTLRDFKVCSNSGGPVGALKHLGGSSYKRLSLLPQDLTRTRLPGQTTNFCQAARTLAVAYEFQDPSTFLPLAFSYARITELPAVTSSLPVVALQSTPWLLQPPASMLCGVGPKLTGADCARAQGSKWAGIDAWACLLKQQVVKNNSNTNNNHCTLSRARMVQVSDQFSLRRSSCAAEVAAKALLSSRRSPLSSQQVSSRHLEIRGSSITTTTTAKAVVVAGRCKSQKYLLQDLTSCLQSDLAHDAGLAVSEECKQLPALIKVYHRGGATARLIIKEVSIKKAPQIAAPLMPAPHPCATRASVQQVTLALNCGKRSLAVKPPCRCLLPCHGGAATCCPGSQQLLTHAQGIFASTRCSATPVLCHLLSERLDTLPSAHAARVAHLHFRWAPISGVIEKTAENRAVRVRPCSVAPTCRVPLFSQVTRSYSCAVTGLSSRLLSGTRQLLLPSGTSRLLLPQASCARKITTTTATTTRKPILASGRMQARGMLLSTFAARFQVVVKSPTPPTTTATTTTATTTMSAEASRAPPKLLRSARFVAGFLGKQLQCSGQSSNKLQCSGKQLQCRDRNVHDNNIKLCLAMHLQPLPLLAASSFVTAIPSVRCNNREVQQQLKSSSRCLINVVPDMPLRCRSSSTSAGLTCALGRESRHSALGRSIGHASFVIAAPLQVRLALSGLKCSSSLATSWASAGRQLGSGSGLTITARAAQLPLGPRHGRAALPRVITPSHLAELAHDAGLASLGEGVSIQLTLQVNYRQRKPVIPAWASGSRGFAAGYQGWLQQIVCQDEPGEPGDLEEEWLSNKHLLHASLQLGLLGCFANLCRVLFAQAELSSLKTLVPSHSSSRKCLLQDKLSAKGHFLAVEHSLQSADLAHDAGLATSEERSQRPRAWRGGQVQKCPATKSVQSASSEDGPESVFCKSGSSVEEAGELFAAASCADGVTEQTRHGKALMLVKDGCMHFHSSNWVRPASSVSQLRTAARAFTSRCQEACQAVAEAWPDGCKPASTHAAKGRILTFLLEEAFHDGLHPKLLRRSSEDRVRFEKSVAFSLQLLRVHSAAQVSTSRVFSLRSLGSSSCALRPRVVESSPEAQYLCSLPTRTAALSLPALQACGAKSRGFSCSCTGAGSSMACGGQGGQQVHCFSHLTTSLLQSPLPAVIASESADAQGDIGSEMTFCFLILSRWFPELGLSSSDPCHSKDAVYGLSCWKRTVPALSSVFSQKRVPSVGTLRMSGDLAKSPSFRFSSTAPGVVRLACTGHCHQKVRCVHKLSASLLAWPLFILSDKQIKFRPTTTPTLTIEDVLFCLLISSNWAVAENSSQASNAMQCYVATGAPVTLQNLASLAPVQRPSSKQIGSGRPVPGFSLIPSLEVSPAGGFLECLLAKATLKLEARVMATRDTHSAPHREAATGVSGSCMDKVWVAPQQAYRVPPRTQLALSSAFSQKCVHFHAQHLISFQTTATSPLTVEEVLICLFISSSWALNSSQPSFTRRPLPSICMPLCEEHSCSGIQAAARGIGTQKFEARIIAAGASRNYSHHLQTSNGPANGASSGRCMHEVWVAPQQAYRVPPMTELALPSVFSQKRVHSLCTAPGVSNVRLACTSHCQQKVPCVYKFSASLLAKPLFVLNDKQISFGPTTNSAITIEEVLICLFISSNWAVNSFQASYAVHRFGASSARSPVQNLAYVAHVDRPRFRRIRSGMPVPSISTPFSLNPSLHGSPAGSFLDCVPAEARGIETLKFKAQAQLLATATPRNYSQESSVDQSKLRLTHQVGEAPSGFSLPRKDSSIIDFWSREKLMKLAAPLGGGCLVESNLHQSAYILGSTSPLKSASSASTGGFLFRAPEEQQQGWCSGIHEQALAATTTRATMLSRHAPAAGERKVLSLRACGFGLQAVFAAATFAAAPPACTSWLLRAAKPRSSSNCQIAAREESLLLHKPAASSLLFSDNLRVKAVSFLKTASHSLLKASSLLSHLVQLGAGDLAHDAGCCDGAKSLSVHVGTSQQHRQLRLSSFDTKQEAQTNSTPASPACDPDAVLKKQRTLSLQRSAFTSSRSRSLVLCAAWKRPACNLHAQFEYTRRPQLTRAMQKPAAADATKTTSAACAIAEKKVLLGIMPRTAAHVHRCFSTERACSTGEVASSMLLLASEFEPMTCNETKTLLLLVDAYLASSATLGLAGMNQLTRMLCLPMEMPCIQLRRSGIPTSARTPRKLVATVSCQGPAMQQQQVASKFSKWHSPSHQQQQQRHSQAQQVATVSGPEEDPPTVDTVRPVSFAQACVQEVGFPLSSIQQSGSVLGQGRQRDSGADYQQLATSCAFVCPVEFCFCAFGQSCSPVESRVLLHPGQPRRQQAVAFCFVGSCLTQQLLRTKASLPRQCNAVAKSAGSVRLVRRSPLCKPACEQFFPMWLGAAAQSQLSQPLSLTGGQSCSRINLTAGVLACGAVLGRGQQSVMKKARAELSLAAVPQSKLLGFNSLALLQMSGADSDEPLKAATTNSGLRVPLVQLALVPASPSEDSASAQLEMATALAPCPLVLLRAAPEQLDRRAVFLQQRRAPRAGLDNNNNNCTLVALLPTGVQASLLSFGALSMHCVLRGQATPSQVDIIMLDFSCSLQLSCKSTTCCTPAVRFAYFAAGVLAPHISRPVPVVVASGDVLQEARLPKTPSYNKQTTVQITTDQQENNHSTAILFLATLKGVDGPSATSEARSLVPCMPCIGSSCSEPSVTHS